VYLILKQREDTNSFTSLCGRNETYLHAVLTSYNGKVAPLHVIKP
jgi:hypothetical protein